MFPLIAEISHKGGAPYLFYRVAARVTSDRYDHAESVVGKIRAVPVLDHEAERNRLAELVAGLANPEQMEEARLRKIAERQKEKEKPKPADTAGPAAEEAGAGAGAGERGAGAAATRGGRDRGARGRRSRAQSRGPWRWLIPVIVVVLVIAALLALLMTGSIPNPWFGGDQTVVSDSEEGESGADGLVTEGTGETGDGETGTDPEQGEAGEAGTDAGVAGDGGEATTTEEPETVLPEGWPPETLPAVRALQENPDVTILADRVIGPGGIEITLLDIINLVNRIATDNGYAPMDVIDPDRPDPDWIYPGNLFVLPNSTRYTVVKGDTLWEITVRYMVARLQQDYQAYVRLTDEHEAEATSAPRRRAIENELATIAADSHSENFTVMVEETLAEWED
jgi:nucleoid-associated protein YgaU